MDAKDGKRGVPNLVSTATPEEQAAAYRRARSIVERIIPKLRDEQPEDVLTALQLLLGKWLADHRFSTDGLISLLQENLPHLKIMWEKANVDIDATREPRLILDSGATRGRGES